jgi:hypothetical protein
MIDAETREVGAKITRAAMVYFLVRLGASESAEGTVELNRSIAAQCCSTPFRCHPSSSG